MSINKDLLMEAKSLGINLSAALENTLRDEVRKRKQEQWLADNADAINAYNRRVAKRGVFSDFITDLSTRVVVPLYPHDESDPPIESLTPEVTIDGKRYLIEVPEIAGVPMSVLGAQVADLSDKRDEVLAAIDLLITGI